jgi:hypothetical protein
MSSSNAPDPDNPVWTAEDFAKALPAEHLPSSFLSAFPKTLERLQRERLMPADGGLLNALRQQGRGADMLALAA